MSDQVSERDQEQRQSLETWTEKVLSVFLAPLLHLRRLTVQSVDSMEDWRADTEESGGAGTVDGSVTVTVTIQTVLS